MNLNDQTSEEDSEALSELTKNLHACKKIMIGQALETEGGPSAFFDNFFKDYMKEEDRLGNRGGENVYINFFNSEELLKLSIAVMALSDLYGIESTEHDNNTKAIRQVFFIPNKTDGSKIHGNLLVLSTRYLTDQEIEDLSKSEGRADILIVSNISKQAASATVN